MQAAYCRDLYFIFALIISLCSVSSIWAENDGILTITTDPPNASLYIDGQLIGQTPLLKHPLPSGQHTLFLRDQTQQVDYTKIIEIAAGDETALNIPLQKDYCKLSVTSKPDSSEVFLLTPLGKTPIYDEQIDQGTFTFEIRNPKSRFVTLRKNNIYIDKNTPCVINDPLPKRKILTPKTMVQIGLGLASAGSYTWSFSRGYWGTQKSAIPGYVLGTVFLTSLGIVALF
ncbi:MAG TPA: PEGA domain-containing protein [Chitinispirillaceae bacterium]|nr:PEGA domain-containing protein [Chitinispirillaceae bacterium]